YLKRKNDFEDVSNIPKSLKKYFEENFIIDSLSVAKHQKATDSTIKFLFKLQDGKSIESVLIPGKQKNEAHKYTLCVSSQVGCSFHCEFCATGKLKFERNLQTSEILDQLFLGEKLSGEKISNIVFMGMGEPLVNYDNVVKAVRILTDFKTKIIHPEKITISTVGIVPKIFQLADEKLNVKLAISLHATTDVLRNKLIPSAAKWNMKLLLEALEYFYKKSKLPLTYEYIMLDDVNDSLDDAKRLAKFARRVSSKVNLIPFNDISFTHPKGFAKQLKSSPMRKVQLFRDILKELDIEVFVRTPSGTDIDAACGQLAFSEKKTKLDSLFP
ncbi:MAG: 23S rRNA (adenine(2503)-C(2))-methyltransferase RlmN, partial [FCB group bacterium]